MCRDGRDRTDDLMVPNHARYQLRYIPIFPRLGLLRVDFNGLLSLFQETISVLPHKNLSTLFGGTVWVPIDPSSSILN